MHVVDATAHLDEEVERCVFAQVLLFSDEVEQVSFTCILQRQVDGVLILETGVQSADVLVVQLFLDSYLSYERLLYFVGGETGFLNLFDCYLDAGSLVLGQLYFTITSFT